MTEGPLDETRWLLKQSPVPDRIVDTGFGPEDDEWFNGIRCPLCRWQPRASDTWCCLAIETPEPPFEGCGTVWNTFATRGRCPGCSHQWRWTSCLRCARWSLHEDWYESGESPA